MDPLAKNKSIDHGGCIDYVIVDLHHFTTTAIPAPYRLCTALEYTDYTFILRLMLVNPESPVACTNGAKVGCTASDWPRRNASALCSRPIRLSPTGESAQSWSWSSLSFLSSHRCQFSTSPNASTNPADRHPPGNLRLHPRPAPPPQQTPTHPALLLMD